MILLFLLCIAHVCSGQEVVYYPGPHIIKHEIVLAPHLSAKPVNSRGQATIDMIYHQQQPKQQTPQALPSKPKKVSFAKIVEQKLNDRFAKYTEFQDRLKISSYTELLNFFKNRYEQKKFGCLADNCIHFDRDYRNEAEHYISGHVSKKFFACIYDDCYHVFVSKKMLCDHIKKCDKSITN